jgi:hypothetical protein
MLRDHFAPYLRTGHWQESEMAKADDDEAILGRTRKRFYRRTK